MPKTIQLVKFAKADLCAAIGASRQIIMAEYDARTDEALSRLASTLPTATALDLLAKLDEAYAECHLSWQNVLSGSEPAMQDQPPPAPRHSRGITPDDGDGDDEHPALAKADQDPKRYHCVH